LPQIHAPFRVLSTTLQIAANAATLVVACLLSVVLIKTYLLRGNTIQPTIVPTGSAGTVAVGAKLTSQLPDVSWDSNGETVILALSTHCHFCTDSAPFFRQLSEKSGRNFKIVAVLPESVAESKIYLDREGVHVNQLKQLSLDRLGVAGTPTMLLLDNRGKVTESWVGMLSPEAQSQALKTIAAAPSHKRTSEL
jgi:thiol-disulfide isomerase/thioredoxin